MNKLFIYIPVEGKQYFSYYHKQILEFFKEKGYVCLNTTPYDSTINHKKEKISYKKYINLLSKADLTVFEVSVATVETGYFICSALELNKSVLVLYLKGNLSEFLSTVKHEKLILVEYKEDNIKSKLSNAMENVKHSSDKRFNFFISSDQLSYLDKEAKKVGLTKSSFIRKLIKEYPKRNPSA